MTQEAHGCKLKSTTWPQKPVEPGLNPLEKELKAVAGIFSEVSKNGTWKGKTYMMEQSAVVMEKEGFGRKDRRRRVGLGQAGAVTRSL